MKRKTHKLATITTLAILILFGYSYAQDKVVVIPLVEEKIAQETYPCTGPDEVMSNNRCWKDRNLGASRVATSSTDAAAYGDLYQWGRIGDGHQNRTSAPEDSNSAYDVPGHSGFITEDSSPWDWRVPQNDILWQGLGGVNNPCPQGFRVPTAGEWQTEMDSWSSNDADGAYTSPLKLVVAGYREYSGGADVNNAGISGSYWSSTIFGGVGGPSRNLFFSGGNANIYNNNRAFGYSVRCIKD